MLLSGLGSLFLTKVEEGIVDQHYKETISNLQRLLSATPTPVVCFLGGTLPGSAHLHLRQLSIFGMIARLTGNFLQTYTLDLFQSGNPPARSWFHQIKELCDKYNLPSPLELLESPLPKLQYKRLVKKHVISFWETSLRLKAAPLESLIFFKPSHMSLTNPHPIWTTAGSSPAKVVMATVQAKMLSGRYRTEALCSNWKIHSTGVCLLSPVCSSTIEDLQHILSHCCALTPTREKLLDFTTRYCLQVSTPISQLITEYTNPSNKDFHQFLIDCSTLPAIISAARLHGYDVHHHLFHVTRTWEYTLHKERLKILGRWNL